MLEVEALRKSFYGTVAVDDVSFKVESGEILGFLGPNGAGKTTTMRMITGFLEPGSGKVTVDGIDAAEKPREARARIGYLPETLSLYPEMRVREYVKFRAELCGVPRRDTKARVEDALATCFVDDVAQKPIGNLSKGYRQRVGLAAALVHGPRVLVLDEPTVGLDPRQIVKVRDLIRDLRKDHTILLSTHILPEVELVCDRVVIIDRGKIVATGTPETLRQQLTQLPAPHGEELLARLPPTEQWPTIEMLTTAGADGYLHTLLELVEAIGVAGIGLSESIGSRFFSHADPGFHMVRA